MFVGFGQVILGLVIQLVSGKLRFLLVLVLSQGLETSNSLGVSVLVSSGLGVSSLFMVWVQSLHQRSVLQGVLLASVVVHFTSSHSSQLSLYRVRVYNS